ncbi:MAG TPA: DUF2069 domain-containing protein [Rhodanobacteraceae bacterium]
MNPVLQQRLGFAAWGALALLQIVWHAWLLPPNGASVVPTLLVALVPLAIPLIYWRQPPRTLLVAGMVCLFYFCHGVAAAFAAPRERVFAWIEIVLAISVIVACAHMPKKRRHAGGSNLSAP